MTQNELDEMHTPLAMHHFVGGLHCIPSNASSTAALDSMLRYLRVFRAASAFRGRYQMDTSSVPSSFLPSRFPPFSLSPSLPSFSCCHSDPVSLSLVLLVSHSHSLNPSLLLVVTVSHTRCLSQPFCLSLLLSLARCTIFSLLLTCLSHSLPTCNVVVEMSGTNAR